MLVTINRHNLQSFLTFYYEYWPRIRAVEHKKWEIGEEEEEEQEGMKTEKKERFR